MCTFRITCRQLLPNSIPFFNTDHSEVSLLKLFRKLFKSTVSCHCQFLKQRKIKLEAKTIKRVILYASSTLRDIFLAKKERNHLILTLLIERHKVN